MHSINQENIVRLILDSAEKSVLKKVVFSKSSDNTLLRAVCTVRALKGVTVLQTELFHSDNKATHKNTALTDSSAILKVVENFMQINVILSTGECEYRRSKSGNDTIVGYQKLINSLSDKELPKIAPSGNNKEKEYILNGNEPFLVLLGISDKNGRVFDKKRAKFRQINRFLELIRDIETHLPTDGTLRICDLCCGKSYLSFAVYHYFTELKKQNVNMTGVDLKSDVIQYCSSVAKQLSFTNLEFLCGDINKYQTEITPHLVISLHACDTATDAVLEKAIEWNTPVILSTPCCHHELNHTLNCPELSFISEHSMLRQKFCDAATDALRLKLLQSHGYSTDALELIDPDETPKNIMLRAILKNNFDKNSRKAKAIRNEYEQAKFFLVRENIV